MTSHLNLLAVATNFPDPIHNWAPWNKLSLDNVADGASITAIVPRPIAPLFMKDNWAIPKCDLGYRYPIYYPRFPFLLPKKTFYSATGNLCRRYVSRFIQANIENGSFEKPDLVHCLHTYLDGYSIMKYTKKNRIPLLVTFHSPYDLNIKYRGVNEKVKQVFDGANRIIIVAEWLREELEKMSVDMEKICYIPLGVDSRQFKPTSDDDAVSVIEKYGLDSYIRVLFVGYLSKNKNTSSLIKAFSIALSNLRNKKIDKRIKLIIVGDGKERSNLINLISILGLEKHVIITGPINHNDPTITSLFGISDIFMLPSFVEGKPVVLYEAMSSGCAIIASNINGVNEQVIDGLNGFLIDPNSTEDIANKLTKLIEDEALLDNMKRESRRLFFIKHYDKKDHSESTLKLYKEVIE